MKHIHNIFLFLVATTFLCCSFPNKIDNNGYDFIYDDIYYKVDFKSENIVQIFSTPKNCTIKTKRLIVDTTLVSYNKFSKCNNDSCIKLKTKCLTVVFNKYNSSFSFIDTQSGKLILSEKGENKARIFKRTIVAEDSCLEVKQSFTTNNDEAIFGLGQYQNGIMNYKGQSVKLLQSNMDIVNPFLVSTKNYGILWDNYSSSIFIDTNDNYSFKSEVSDASDYYFIYGNNIDDVVAGYRKLTGNVPMFSKWVYGFWQSKERYKSFDELIDVIKEYRKRKIPLDNIVQDWEYWGDKEHWNALCFNSAHFKNPKEAINKIKNNNVHIMISVWPGFGKKTDVYKSLDSIGALFNEPTWAGYKIFDAYNPKARDIVWKYLKRGLYDMGIDAWWMDATEPSFKEGFTQLKQEEKTKSAGNTYLGTFHRYLNTYSLELLKDFYSRLRLEDNTKRPFILTRSAFASQQHFATAVWSGDVSASWKNMKKQLIAGLNLTISGIPYWTSDIGGFFVTERDAMFPDGLKDNEYKELYSRWFQFGAFTPIFRAHGTNVPREIWQFGEEGDLYYDNQVKYIKLRYRLLPYIYSTSYMVTSRNYTMMRALPFDFSNDKATYNIDYEYMFGPSLLVRPVFKPQKEENYTNIYLPKHKNTYWFDYWTKQVYAGGTNIKQKSILNELPLYVKCGSIIPYSNVKQYAMEYPDKQLEIEIYGGADSSFLLYDDDGNTNDFENGKYSKIKFDWNNKNQTLYISEREGSYYGMADTIEMKLKLYLPNSQIIKKKECIYKGNKTQIKF